MLRVNHLIGFGAAAAQSVGPPPPDLTYALLLSSIDELDPPSGLLLSGDETDGNDVLELSGDQR